MLPDSPDPVVSPFVVGELRIAVSVPTPRSLRVDWMGRSDHREPGRALAPFFDELLDRAQQTGGAIEMHFERLAHFNSSTITALIQLIRSARTRQVQLAMFFDADAKWQQLSFDALGIFEQTDGLVRFQGVGGEMEPAS
jgi:hypothetical protein